MMYEFDAILFSSEPTWKVVVLNVWCEEKLALIMDVFGATLNQLTIVCGRCLHSIIMKCILMWYIWR